MRASVLVLALLLVCVASVRSADATKGQIFEVSLNAASSATLDATSPVTMHDVVVMARRFACNAGAAQSGMTASADEIRVTKWEYERRATDPRLGSPLGLHVPGSLPTASNQTFHDVSIRLSLDPARSAFVVRTGEATGWLRSSAGHILGVETNPVVRDTGQAHSGSESFLPEEFGRQQVAGRFVVVEGMGTELAGRGDSTLYWYNGTMVVAHARGLDQLVSKYERFSDESGTTIRERVSWFELAIRGFKMDLALGASCAASKVSMMAGALETDAVSSIAIDSASVRQGEIPKGARLNGSSLWLAGRFSARLSASSAAPSSEPSEGFVVFLAGEAFATSSGGGPLAILTAAGDPTLFGLGLLAVFVVAYRDALAVLLSRVELPLYTKLRKDELLNVESRDKLYRMIQSTPGINFLGLHHEFAKVGHGPKIAFGALAYHLAQMERFELIVSKREGRFRRYYDVSARMGADVSRIALLQTRPVPIVARAVLDHPGATQSMLFQQVGAELGVTRQTLAYHLRRLVAKDLVVREATGRFSRYRPTERLEKLVAYVSPPARRPGPTEGAPAST